MFSVSPSPLCRLLLSVPSLPACLSSHFSALSRFEKGAHATDAPESNRDISIVNGILLSELCRLDVVGVAVFPHVGFKFLIKSSR